MSRTAVSHTPRPGEDINLLLVFGVLCLAIDRVDLDRTRAARLQQRAAARYVFLKSIVITNYSKALIDLDPARVSHEMRDENGRMFVIWPLGRTAGAEQSARRGRGGVQFLLPLRARSQGARRRSPSFAGYIGIRYTLLLVGAGMGHPTPRTSPKVSSCTCCKIGL